MKFIKILLSAAAILLAFGTVSASKKVDIKKADAPQQLDAKTTTALEHVQSLTPEQSKAFQLAMQKKFLADKEKNAQIEKEKVDKKTKASKRRVSKNTSNKYKLKKALKLRKRTGKAGLITSVYKASKKSKASTVNV